MSEHNPNHWEALERNIFFPFLFFRSFEREGEKRWKEKDGKERFPENERYAMTLQARFSRMRILNSHERLDNDKHWNSDELLSSSENEFLAVISLVG